jgi:hypothetical protein
MKHIIQTTVARQSLAGKRVGKLQITRNLGQDSSTAEEVYECKCACGTLYQLTKPEMQDQSGLGVFTCRVCAPAVQRPATAKQELRNDMEAQRKAAALILAEKQRLRAIQAQAEYEARLTLEFGPEYVQELNARNVRRAQR